MRTSLKAPKSSLELFTISLVFLLGLSANASQTTPFSSSLILDMPLDGSVVDVGPNNFAVIVNGGGTWVPNRFLKSNSAFSLNGIDQNITLPFNAALYPTEFTLSAWIKLGQNGVSTLWCAGNATEDTWRGFGLEIGPSFSYQDFTGSGYNASLQISLTNLQGWCQIVMTRTTNSAALYVNGVKINSATGLTPYAKPQVAPMNIGANNGYGPFFNFTKVTFDSLHIYNRAFSENEVAQLYAVESTDLSPTYLNLTIALKISKQNANKVSGAISTTASPRLLTLATKDILNMLAFDKHAEGQWPSSSFPKSAALALAGSSIVVLNGTNILLNVSDIMSFNTGDQKIISGKQNIVTGLASSTAQKFQIAGIIFDDTFISGGKNMKFYLKGVLLQTTTDTAPVNGVYTETQTLRLTAGAGDGLSQDVPLICTGSVSATGKSPLHL